MSADQITDECDDMLNIMIGEFEANRYLVSVHITFIFRFANTHQLQSKLHSDSTENTSSTSISTSEIRKLLLDSVELQKMKVANQKLKDALNEKHAELQILQKKFRFYEKTGEVSSVSK